MFTSYYKNVPPREQKAISISRGVPHGYKQYRPLAPGAWFKSVDEQEYRRRYFERLSRLDPVEVLCDLFELTGQLDPILLCYEPPGQFCHRRLVAEWLEDSFPSMKVPELVLQPRSLAVAKPLEATTKEITCLTIWQPWASLILGSSGLQKDCENRTWRPPQGLSEIWIHSGKKWDEDGAKFVYEWFDTSLNPADFPLGKILGSVSLDGSTQDHDSEWAIAGQWHWLFSNPKKLANPIPHKGQLGLWKAQVSEKQLQVPATTTTTTTTTRKTTKRNESQQQLTLDFGVNFLL